MIAETSSVSSAASPSSVTNDAQVSQEDFLTLLVAQLQNQDPLNPVENQEFISELAVFSSLEQETNQTQLLEDLIATVESTMQTDALSLIGKEVVVAQDEFYFEPGDEQTFIYNAEQDGDVTIQVKTDSGTTVFTDVVTVPSGQQEYTFDGRDSQGDVLPAGIYSIQILSSIDSEGDRTEYTPYLRGTVDGVSYYDGIPVLTVNGQPVEMGAVQAVFEGGGEE